MSDATKNPDKTPVAGDVYTYCTKEKTETWHVVVAHNASGIVDRVQCKACGSNHKYRPQRASSAAKRPGGSSVLLRRGGVEIRAGGGGARKSAASSRSSSTSTRVLTASQLEEQWFSGLKNWGEKSVPKFDPKTSFQTGEVLEHEVFGKGVVQARRENKIDVLFKEGVKTLPSKLPPLT